ncbi:MAG TPA: hypothetical protein VHZ07_15155 [Bryobacteraceae bacterium]|jgi:hypothetical protein|nr:hypothetical protein [Bryobacteraceae bacterium]
MPDHLVRSLEGITTAQHKALFRTALRHAGVGENLLATWAAEETKREYWARLIPNLESSDAGVAALNRHADAVSEQNTFPDLESTEDSVLRIRNAKTAIADLRDCRQRQSEKAQFANRPSLSSSRGFRK